MTTCALFRVPCSIFRTLTQTALGCSELNDKYTAYFSVRTAGYIWTDYKTNAQIAKELKITPILDKLLEYKKKLDTTCK